MRFQLLFQLLWVQWVLNSPQVIYDINTWNLEMSSILGLKNPPKKGPSSNQNRGHHLASRPKKWTFDYLLGRLDGLCGGLESLVRPAKRNEPQMDDYGFTRELLRQESLHLMTVAMAELAKNEDGFWESLQVFFAQPSSFMLNLFLPNLVGISPIGS